MSKLNLENLKKLRQEQKEIFNKCHNEAGEIHIIIGMSSCGVAAGARETLKVFQEEIKNKNINNVKIRKTGCLGLCYSEPSVEVRVPGMPTVVYGNVSSQVASKIVNKHIIARRLVNNHIFNKPSEDILK